MLLFFFMLEYVFIETLSYGAKPLKKTKHRKLIGNLLLLFTAVIWGTAFMFQRTGMEDIQPLTFNAARMALAAVFIGTLAFLLRGKFPAGPKESGTNISGEPQDTHSSKQSRNSLLQTIRGGVVCGCFLSFASIFQQMGLVYTTAGKAGFITAMYMLIVPIISFLVFKKKNTWLVWVSVFLGIVGMYLLCMTESFSLSKGDALVLICAFLFSGHILSCDHYARRGNPLAISAVQFTVATIISAIGAMIWETPTLHQLWVAALPILYCGLVSGGIGYTLQMIAQKMTDPTTASLIMSLESVFAALSGAIFIHETMQAKEIAGCIVMFLAIILVQLPIGRHSDQC